MSALYIVDSDGNKTFIGTNPPISLVGVPSTLTFEADGTVTLGPIQIIPIRATASQNLSVALNNQSCTVNLYFKEFWVPLAGAIPTDPPTYEATQQLFLDLYLSGVLICGGVLCQDRNLIVRDPTGAFTGDLAFIDTVGTADPEIEGLGTRWLLTYWSDLP